MSQYEPHGKYTDAQLGAGTTPMKVPGLCKADSAGVCR